MKNNKVLVVLSGCLLIFAGASFASEVPVSQDWSSWFAAKQAALKSWYSDVTGRTEGKKALGEMAQEVKKGAEKYRVEELVRRQQEEKEQKRLQLDLFTETRVDKIRRTRESLNGVLDSILGLELKISALTHIQEFLDMLKDEKLERQLLLQVCDEKLKELAGQQRLMREQQKEMRSQEEKLQKKIRKQQEEVYREEERRHQYEQIQGEKEQEVMRQQEQESRLQREREEKEKQESMRKAAITKDINRTTRDSIIFALEKDGLINLAKRDQLLEISRNNDRKAIEEAIAFTREDYEKTQNPTSKTLLDKLIRIQALM